MTELELIFEELGLQQYLGDFIEQGFDSWETILDITESDFNALGVKLGHRRKLQRKIANTRGFAADTALPHSSGNTPIDDRASEESKSGAKSDSKEPAPITQGAKRKYRRHPKADEHAPGRPPSAYVLFSNSMRNELKDQTLSFTEIAKLVGENWQSLSAAEKEPFEQEAFIAKERYNSELAEYKKTSHFKEYMNYLAEFKERQANSQPVTDLDPKRPKLEPHTSATSTGTTSSGGMSQQGGDTPASRLRVEPTSSNNSPWIPADGKPSPLLPHLNAVRLHGSPPSSSTVLPGYRDAFFKDGRPILVGIRDDPRDEMHQLPRISSVGSIDAHNMTSPGRRSHRIVASSAPPPPPLLTHESTAASSSYSMPTPRTPMEAVMDNSNMAYFPKRYPGNYENQLPPIQAASLSPQGQNANPHSSQNGISPGIEFPTPKVPTIPPIRSHPPSTSSYHAPSMERIDSRHREVGPRDASNVDPVSLLIMASELQKQNSQR